MTVCDYTCPQNNNGKCMAPGYRECLKAKKSITNLTTTIGEIVGADKEIDLPDVYYVFGKKNAKKAKEQFPNLTVMYRNSRTKGLYVEYKED